MDQFDSLRRFQSEDEHEALARALELSLEAHNDRQKSAGVKAQLSHGETRALSNRELSIPLCLPDNCKWDSQTGKSIKAGDKRTSLHVVDEALDQLRRVKGPVCVVSVAGPYRKGKSYILSEAFDQPDVFPLGHEMVAETMGIWLWIVPEKYKDSNGNEFTVILLDSEGIDSAATEGFHDHQIFTLTVLLASVLIYNSQDVPTRHDIEGLDFIAKLSQRIQMRSTTGAVNGQSDMEFYHKTFPYFIWLLRDVTKTIPTDCKDIKDYFLKKVFKEQGSSTNDYKSKQVAESILRFFSGFDAFTLPSPTVDPETMKSINQKKHEVNPKFFSGLEKFKSLLRTTLSPKRSFNDGEFVTGEGLAALVLLYVDAINSPDAIPNVQSAWDSFVETKCSDGKQAALMTYDALLTSQLTGELPCDNDVIRMSHSTAFNMCEDQLMAEMAGISTSKVERVVTELKESLANKLNCWLTENEAQTTQSCKDLLGQLKRTHLDPVLQKLQGKDAAEVSFDDVISGYTRIKDDYHNSAKGAKDVIAKVFFEFHPELVKEKEQYLGLLRQLKDFNEERSRVLAAQAYQEQERKRLEEQQSRLQEENRQQKKEMEMLLQNLDEERKRFSEEMESERKAQQGQLENMMATSMKQAQEERRAFIKENQALKDQFLALQQVNENNMKIIEKMSEMAAQRQQEEKELRERMKAQADEDNEALMRKLNEKHDKEMEAMQQVNENNMKMIEKMSQRQQEEKELRERMKAQADEDNEALMRKLNEKHDKEMEAVRDEMNAKLGEVMRQVPPSETILCGTPGLIKKRAKTADHLQGRIQQTRGEQENVEKPGFFKKALQFVGKLILPAVGAVVSAVAPVAAPIAAPLAAGASFVAETFCSVM